MAYKPSSLKDLKEFLSDSDPREIASFLSQHPKKSQTFLDLGKDDYKRLLRYLNSENEEELQGACLRLDLCLEKREALLAGFLLDEKPAPKKIPAAQADMRRIKRNEELKLAGSSFGRAASNVRNGELYPAFQNSVRGMTELKVAFLSHAGLGRVGRAAWVAGIEIPTFLLVAKMAATNFVGEAKAAIPVDVEPASHADTLKERFNAPLELTITPKKSDPFAAIMQGEYKMMPSLIRHMERDPQAKEYVEWCLEAAAKSDINGNLFANQMYKESFWFKPEVINGTITSPTGAMGIAQFMPGTAKALGVDPLKPQEAIFAAAKHMGDLTRQYGEQHLAMVVYNGRSEALDFAQTELGLNKTPTIHQWMSFMNERYERLGDEARHAWHVETRGYIQQISSQFWDNGVQRVALHVPKLPQIVPLPMARPQ